MFKKFFAFLILCLIFAIRLKAEDEKLHDYGKRATSKISLSSSVNATDDFVVSGKKVQVKITTKDDSNFDDCDASDGFKYQYTLDSVDEGSFGSCYVGTYILELIPRNIGIGELIVTRTVDGLPNSDIEIQPSDEITFFVVPIFDTTIEKSHLSPSESTTVTIDSHDVDVNPYDANYEDLNAFDENNNAFDVSAVLDEDAKYSFEVQFDSAGSHTVYVKYKYDGTKTFNAKTLKFYVLDDLKIVENSLAINSGKTVKVGEESSLEIEIEKEEDSTKPENIYDYKVTLTNDDYSIVLENGDIEYLDGVLKSIFTPNNKGVYEIKVEYKLKDDSVTKTASSSSLTFGVYGSPSALEVISVEQGENLINLVDDSYEIDGCGDDVTVLIELQDSEEYQIPFDSESDITGCSSSEMDGTKLKCTIKNAEAKIYSLALSSSSSIKVDIKLAIVPGEFDHVNMIFTGTGNEISAGEDGTFEITAIDVCGVKITDIDITLSCGSDDGCDLGSGTLTGDHFVYEFNLKVAKQYTFIAKKDTTELDGSITITVNPEIASSFFVDILEEESIAGEDISIIVKSNDLYENDALLNSNKIVLGFTKEGAEYVTNSVVCSDNSEFEVSCTVSITIASDYIVFVQSYDGETEIDSVKTPFTVIAADPSYLEINGLETSLEVGTESKFVVWAVDEFNNNATLNENEIVLTIKEKSCLDDSVETCVEQCNADSTCEVECSSEESLYSYDCNYKFENHEDDKDISCSPTEKSNALECSFTITLANANYQVIGKYKTVTVGSSSFIVNPSTPTQFTIDGDFKSEIEAGSENTFTITALDTYENNAKFDSLLSSLVFYNKTCVDESEDDCEVNAENNECVQIEDDFKLSCTYTINIVDEYILNVLYDTSNEKTHDFSVYAKLSNFALSGNDNSDTGIESTVKISVNAVDEYGNEGKIETDKLELIFTNKICVDEKYDQCITECESNEECELLCIKENYLDECKYGFDHPEGVDQYCTLTPLDEIFEVECSFTISLASIFDISIVYRDIPRTLLETFEFTSIAKPQNFEITIEGDVIAGVESTIIVTVDEEDAFGNLVTLVPGKIELTVMKESCLVTSVETCVEQCDEEDETCKEECISEEKLISYDCDYKFDNHEDERTIVCSSTEKSNVLECSFTITLANSNYIVSIEYRDVIRTQSSNPYLFPVIPAIISDLHSKMPLITTGIIGSQVSIPIEPYDKYFNQITLIESNAITLHASYIVKENVINEYNYSGDFGSYRFDILLDSSYNVSENYIIYVKQVGSGDFSVGPKSLKVIYGPIDRVNLLPVLPGDEDITIVGDDGLLFSATAMYGKSGSIRFQTLNEYRFPVPSSCESNEVINLNGQSFSSCYSGAGASLKEVSLKYFCKFGTNDGYYEYNYETIGINENGCDIDFEFVGGVEGFNFVVTRGDVEEIKATGVDMTGEIINAMAGKPEQIALTGYNKYSKLVPFHTEETIEQSCVDSTECLFDDIERVDGKYMFTFESLVEKDYVVDVLFNDVSFKTFEIHVKYRDVVELIAVEKPVGPITVGDSVAYKLKGENSEHAYVPLEDYDVNVFGDECGASNDLTIEDGHIKYAFTTSKIVEDCQIKFEIKKDGDSWNLYVPITVERGSVETLEHDLPDNTILYAGESTTVTVSAKNKNGLSIEIEENDKIAAACQGSTDCVIEGEIQSGNYVFSFKSEVEGDYSIEVTMDGEVEITLSVKVTYGGVETIEFVEVPSTVVLGSESVVVSFKLFNREGIQLPTDSDVADQIVVSSSDCNDLTFELTSFAENTLSYEFNALSISECNVDVKEVSKKVGQFSVSIVRGTVSKISLSLSESKSYVAGEEFVILLEDAENEHGASIDLLSTDSVQVVVEDIESHLYKLTPVTSGGLLTSLKVVPEISATFTFESVLINSVEVDASFELKVEEGDLTKLVIVNKNEVMQVGENNYVFAVAAHNQFGKVINTVDKVDIADNGGLIELTLVESPSKTNLQVNGGDYGYDLAQFEFSTVKSGDYKVAFKVDEVIPNGGRYNLVVVPETIEPSETYATGSGIKLVANGKKVSFIVNLYDKYSNKLKYTENQVILSGKINGSNVDLTMTEFNGDLVISYTTPAETGRYAVSLFAYIEGGDGDKEIKNSPYMIDVFKTGERPSMPSNIGADERLDVGEEGAVFNGSVDVSGSLSFGSDSQVGASSSFLGQGTPLIVVVDDGSVRLGGSFEFSIENEEDFKAVTGGGGNSSVRAEKTITIVDGPSSGSFEYTVANTFNSCLIITATGEKESNGNTVVKIVSTEIENCGVVKEPKNYKDVAIAGIVIACLLAAVIIVLVVVFVILRKKKKESSSSSSQKGVQSKSYEVDTIKTGKGEAKNESEDDDQTDDESEDYDQEDESEQEQSEEESSGQDQESSEQDQESSEQDQESTEGSSQEGSEQEEESSQYSSGDEESS